MAPHSETPPSDVPAAQAEHPAQDIKHVDTNPFESTPKAKFPSPPAFQDKYQERQYQKERLALAFRIFAKLGFDEGVAGHITLRVCLLALTTILFSLPLF